MSTAEELVNAPSSNGVESNAMNDRSPAKTEKLEIKSVADISDKSESKEKPSADINHEVPTPPITTTDVEMKEIKEKTPEIEHPKPAPSSPEKSKTVDEQKRQHDKTNDEKAAAEKSSGEEEKFECVTVKPLTAGGETPEKKKTEIKIIDEAAAAAGEKQVAEESGAGEEDKEKLGQDEETGATVEEEQHELDSSPKKRGRRPAAKKPATPKKTPKKAKTADDDATAAGEQDEAEEKSTPEKNPKKDDADAAAASSPTKTPSRKPRQKSQDKPAVSTDTSPKTPLDKTPLLEAPLVIEGKRTRQRVERLDAQMLTPTQKEIEIPHGTGSKLGEIPFVEAMISKTPSNDLKTIHKILYGRPGTTQEIKKNLRGFCGFGYAENSKEFERKRKSLDHYQVKDLKKVCEVFGLERSGPKEQLVEHVMVYLVEPKDQGKKPPQPAAKRKRSTSRKSSDKGSKLKKSGSAKKAGGKDMSEGSAEDDEEDEEEDEAKEESEKDEEVAEEAEKEEEEEAPKSKKAKKEKPSTSAVAAAASSPSKRGQPKRGKTTYPSDTDIKNTIRELLKGMNLEEVTMKEMTKKVYDKYPGVDISNKKDFIKETVKALLSASD